MGVTKRKPYTEMVKLVWNKNIKSQYVKTKETYTESQQKNNTKITEKEVIESYEDANENAKLQISNWIDSGGIDNERGSIPGYNYAQNHWQMMGGPNGDDDMGVWTGSDEQKARAKELMWEDTKRMFGKETSISNYGVNESEYKKSKLTKPEIAALKIAEEDGITLYPFAAGASEDEKKDTKKRKLKEINIALGLPEDNIKIDLKDVKNNFSKLNADNNLLAVNLLNSMNASPGTSGKLYYQGLEIADSLPQGADLDATWKKVGASYESIDLLDYPALEKELLNAITASKQYQSVKQSNITPYTDTYDLGSVDKLNEIDFSNPEALRSYYQSNQT